MNKPLLISPVRRCVCLALFGALPFTAPLAEEADLGTVVVTATRTEREVADVPASVTVITAADIQRSTAQSADELLQELAGVDVRHGIGALSVGTSNKVTLRGMGGLTEARALLLIDGVPVNEVYNGGVEWNMIPVEDIRRIEVVRGASSALYGSNAMGGVINILTKRPTRESRVGVSLGYGGMNTRDGSLSLSGTSGRVGYRLSGSVLRSDGYNPLQSKDRKATSIDKGSERENLRGTLSFALGEGSSLDLGADYYHHQSTGTYAIDGYNPYEQDNRSLTARYARRLDNGGELSASLYTKSEESGYDSVNYRTGYTSTLSDSASDQDNFGGNLQYSVPFAATASGDHILTTGLDFRQGEVYREDHYYDGSNRLIKTAGGQRYAGIYLQDEIFLLDDQLVVNLGGRYDYWKNYDGYSYDTVAAPLETTFEEATSTSFNPKLAASYRLTPDTTLRGSVGKAFRAPTLYDLYRTYIAGTSIYAPNPNLGAESVRAYELGLDRRFGDAATLSMTLYRNDAEDFISTLSVPCTDPAFRRCFRKANVGEVSTEGLEAELHYTVTPRWELFANYTYNRSLVERYDPDPALEGNLLPDTPEHKGAFGVTFTDPSLFTARASARYVGKRYSNDTNSTVYDSYALVDLHLSKAFDKRYRLSVDVSDLFDKGYTEYYLSPGRTITARVSATF